MMIAEREREREGGGSSFLYVSDCSVQIFIWYFSQKGVLNWNDWSSLNCSDAKDIILFLPQIEILYGYSLDPALQTAEFDSFFLFFQRRTHQDYGSSSELGRHHRTEPGSAVWGLQRFLPESQI